MLDRLETLVSPQALAGLFAAREEDLIEFEKGIEQIMELRWGLQGLAASLASALDARHVDQDDGAAYLLTSLWRRRKRLPVDPDRPTAHGLGARFPLPEHLSSRRADVIILRRQFWQPPADDPAPPDAGVD